MLNKVHPKCLSNAVFILLPRFSFADKRIISFGNVCQVWLCLNSRLFSQPTPVFVQKVWTLLSNIVYLLLCHSCCVTHKVTLTNCISFLFRLTHRHRTEIGRRLSLLNESASRCLSVTTDLKRSAAMLDEIETTCRQLSVDIGPTVDEAKRLIQRIQVCQSTQH